MAKKKKKRSAETMHRQVQDSVQALPYVIDQQKKEGKRIRAFVLRYFSGPLLRLVNRALNAKRYRGTEGQKLKQTEQMRRHLQHKKAAVKHMETQVQAAQKKKR
jgi:ribosomal protein L35